MRTVNRIKVFAALVAVLGALTVEIGPSSHRAGAAPSTAPPAVALVSPLDGANVPAGEVRIVASASGAIDRDNVEVLVTRTSSEAVERVRSSWTNNTLTSAPVAVAPGDALRVEVIVGSDTGVIARATSTFRGIGVAFESHSPSLRTAPTTTFAPTSAVGVNRITFTDVAMDIPTTRVNLTGALGHPGVGYIAHQIDLAASSIELFVPFYGGELSIGNVRAPASWGQRVAYQQLPLIGMGLDTQSVRTAQTKVHLDSPLALDVPASVVRAELHLAGTTPYVPTCAQASGCERDRYPTADLAPFHLSLNDAARLLTAETIAADLGAGTNAAAPPCDPVGGVNACEHPQISDFAPSQVWQLTFDRVNVAWQLVAIVGEENLWGLVYDSTLPIAPTRFSEACLQWACSSSAAASSSQQSETLCGTMKGRIENNRNACYQFIKVTMRSDGSGNSHNFSALMGATFGMWDAERDQFAINTRNTSAGAAYVGLNGYRGYNYSVAESYDPTTGATACRTVHEYPQVQQTVEARVTQGNGHWSYSSNLTYLPQSTRTYSWCEVGYGYAVPNRLWFALIFSDQAHVDGFQGRPGEVTARYGHNKTVQTQEWGCGVDVFPEPGPGCGWSPSTSRERVWTLDVSTNYSY